jgi:hypothetical protein
MHHTTFSNVHLVDCGLPEMSWRITHSPTHQGADRNHVFLKSHLEKLGEIKASH